MVGLAMLLAPQFLPFLCGSTAVKDVKFSQPFLQWRESKGLTLLGQFQREHS
jgi:hypothetical protein